MSVADRATHEDRHGGGAGGTGQPPMTGRVDHDCASGRSTTDQTRRTISMSARRTLALGGLAAVTAAALTTGTAAAQDVPPVPPVPPVAAQNQQHDGQGTQVTRIPGGTLVQGPHGQEFIPNGVQGSVPQQHDGG
jgi:hypothetical protein